MLPLTDAVPPRRVPWVTLLLVAANLLVWFAYQLPAGLEASVDEVGFRACSLAGDCSEASESALWTATTCMFAHGGWAHLAGNMVFLLALGPRVEAELGALRYAFLYVAAGYAATLVEGGTQLAFLSAEDANVPSIGASGAISGVIAAYVVLFPFERVLTYLVPMFFLRIPAVALLVVWFALQALEGTYGLTHPEENWAGIAFFAHVGGFAAGFVLAAALVATSWPRALLGGQPKQTALP